MNTTYMFLSSLRMVTRYYIHVLMPIAICSDSLRSSDRKLVVLFLILSRVSFQNCADFYRVAIRFADDSYIASDVYHVNLINIATSGELAIYAIVVCYFNVSLYSCQFMKFQYRLTIVAYIYKHYSLTHSDRIILCHVLEKNILVFNILHIRIQYLFI